MAWFDSAELGYESMLKLQRILTITPKATSQYSEPSPIHLYKVEMGRLGVPRAFFLNRWAEEGLDKHEVKVDVSHGKWIALKFKGELREKQVSPCKIYVNMAKNEPNFYGGIISLSCGTGKTVLALKIIQELGLKTLVIVHKEFLVNQWKERIEQFLPGAKVGRIQQDVCDYKDKDIVIGMVHSIAGKDDYPSEIYKEFGLIVADEVHRMAAPTFSLAMPKFNARFRLGLSATVNRKDRSENVFLWAIGGVVYKSAEQPLKAVVKRVKSNFRLVPYGRFDPNKAALGRILTMLSRNKERNILVAGVLYEAASAGRKILVLSERLEHLKTLSIMLNEVAGRNNKKFTYDYYIGGRDEDELDVASQAQVIFGTFQMACIMPECTVTNYITGEELTLKKIIDNKHKIDYITKNDDNMFILKESCQMAYTGKKPCIEIETDIGSLKVSSDHVVYTQRGEVRAGEITKTDYLLSPLRISIDEVPVVDLTDDDFWLLGALIGDGNTSCITSGTAGFTNVDKDIIDEVDLLLRKHGMSLVVTKSRKSHFRITSFKGVHGKKEKTWLRQICEKYNLVNSCLNKKFPKEFMIAPISNIKNLLGGLFDTDGGISVRNNRRAYCYYSTSSNYLAGQIQMLLLRLGIPTKRHLNKKDGYPDNVVITIPRAYICKFNETVNIRLKRKKSLIQNFLRNNITLTVSKWNRTPTQFVREIKEILKKDKMLLKFKDSCKRFGYSVSGLIIKREIPKELYDKSLEFLKIKNKFENFMFIKIKNIKNLGEQEVCDISIKDNHNLVVNGFLVHNSEGLDIPDLDTLLMATPKTDIIQSAGRILRVHDDKKQPIIVDIVDTSVGIFAGMYRVRLRTYIDKGWLHE